jgi:hypothetical protein
LKVGYSSFLEEFDLFTTMDAPHGKWFVPLMWMINLIKKQKAAGKIDR